MFNAYNGTQWNNMVLTMELNGIIWFLQWNSMGMFNAYNGTQWNNMVLIGNVLKCFILEGCLSGTAINLYEMFSAYNGSQWNNMVLTMELNGKNTELHRDLNQF